MKMTLRVLFISDVMNSEVCSIESSTPMVLLEIPPNRSYGLVDDRSRDLMKFILRLRPLPPAPFSSSCLPFGRLGASTLAPCETILAPRENLGRPWEHQDGFEGVRHRILILSGSITKLFLEMFGH